VDSALTWCRRVNDLATGGLAADYTIYLDLKVELALERRRKRDADARIEDLAKHVHGTLMARFPHFPYKTLDI
jgi:thymidylate kinase